MAEKGLEKKELVKILAGFEKRQDENFKVLEEKVSDEWKALERRMDGRFKGMEEKADGRSTNLERRMVDQFHIISEGLIHQIKLLAEGHAGIIERLSCMEKENEHQHLETRSLVKLSFTELDKRLTDLESQMKEVQEWKKRVEARFQM